MIFQMASAVFALLAAFAWGLSAIGRIDPPHVGWGGVISKDDPFIKGIVRSAKLNQAGAAFAAFSAVFGACVTYLT